MPAMKIWPEWAGLSVFLALAAGGCKLAGLPSVGGRVTASQPVFSVLAVGLVWSGWSSLRQMTVLLLGYSLLSLLHISCLDVSVAATPSVSEVCIFIRNCYAAPNPVGIGAAMVSTDWVALGSLWEAPTLHFIRKEYRLWIDLIYGDRL
jgi:hypothetical protein